MHFSVLNAEIGSDALFLCCDAARCNLWYLNDRQVQSIRLEQPLIDVAILRWKLAISFVYVEVVLKVAGRQEAHL